MDARGHGARPSRRAPRPTTGAGSAATRSAWRTRSASEHGAPRIALGLGHSFGGTALVTASAQRPELFERLVLVDMIAPPRPGSELEALRRARGNPFAEGARKRNAVWPSREAAAREMARQGAVRGLGPARVRAVSGRGAARPAGRTGGARLSARDRGGDLRGQRQPRRARAGVEGARPRAGAVGARRGLSVYALRESGFADARGRAAGRRRGAPGADGEARSWWCARCCASFSARPGSSASSSRSSPRPSRPPAGSPSPGASAPRARCGGRRRSRAPAGGRGPRARRRASGARGPPSPRESRAGSCARPGIRPAANSSGSRTSRKLQPSRSGCASRRAASSGGISRIFASASRTKSFSDFAMPFKLSRSRARRAPPRRSPPDRPGRGGPRRRRPPASRRGRGSRPAAGSGTGRTSRREA